MAEKDDATSSFPWVPLIGSLGIVSGLFLLLPQITSSRPGGGDPRLAVPPADPQAVDARLWEDPLGVAIADWERVKRNPDDRIRRSDAIRHWISNFQELLIAKCYAPLTCTPKVCPALANDEYLESASNRLAVCAIMIPGGPYVDDVERRLRARRALVEALDSADYHPENDHELRYFAVPWVDLQGNPAAASLVLHDTRNTEQNSSSVQKVAYTAQGGSSYASASSVEPVRLSAYTEPVVLSAYSVNEAPIVVPYEWYEKYDVAAKTREFVLVLWLNDDAFLDAPIARLGDLNSWFGLLNKSTKHPVPLPSFYVFGPDNSGTLHNLTVEAAVNAWDPDTRGLLATTHIYSAQASASDEQILYDAQGTSKTCKALIEDAMRRGALGTGFTFDRTVPLDDEMVKTLWRELPNWDIQPSDRVAVISELDTFYARALSGSFKGTGNEHAPFVVQTYAYLRGIDGKLPTDEKDKNTKTAVDNADKSTPAATKPTEQTEGLNRADDIRRLAKELRECIGRDHKLKAVGLLGSDVYDKLEILKALRPEFPEALFFTNNLDARLALPEELSETHNLLIVSSYPLSPTNEATTIAPFRDSAQTALYTSVLAAVEKRPICEPTPVVYQVGRNGFSTVESSGSVRNEIVISGVKVIALIVLGALLIKWSYFVSRIRPSNEESKKGSLAKDA
jgi:hypothetical protein